MRSAFYARRAPAPATGKAGAGVGLEEAVLLATGSADGAVYVYDLTDGQPSDQPLLQRLAGHQACPSPTTVGTVVVSFLLVLRPKVKVNKLEKSVITPHIYIYIYIRVIQIRV